MELDMFVDRLRHELHTAAAAGGPDAAALAERLTGPLDAAVRLVLLEALSAAADEITRDLAPGSVEVRLRGADPGFAVTAPPVDDDAAVAPPPVGAAPPAGAADHGAAGTGAHPVPDAPGESTAEDGPTIRINLRLPDGLKQRVDRAAALEHLSVNAWLVRAAAAALAPPPVPPTAATGTSVGRGGHSLTGWVH